MSRFLGLALFLIIAAGLAIHAGLQFPRLLEWFGKLPGDLIIKKKGLIIYIPITSSLLVSAAVSLILSLFSRR